MTTTGRTTRRTTRGKAKATPKTASRSAKAKKANNNKRRRGVDPEEDSDQEDEEPVESSADSGSEFEVAVDNSDADDGEDTKSLHSDALDEDSDDDGHVKTNMRKRKRGPTSKNSRTKSPRKSVAGKANKRRRKQDDDDEDVPGDLELELEEGQEIVGTVVQAPKTGRVPPGQISSNTIDFLTKLKRPECNDREWFKLHEPVYRLAEQEWKAFVEEFTSVLIEVDPQIPPLPPKDLIHRIYRDVRFSNDKTPYKSHFSASFTRSGRKGVFAGYHVAVEPGGQSIIAAGSWQPGKNELQTIRNNLLRSSTRFRRIISSPEFVRLFGKPEPPPKGSKNNKSNRQNIFGREDELKVAPKGVEKNHPDIDLLKCRTFAVMHRFTDEQVLSPNFKHDLAQVATVMRPFVHYLNELMTIQGGADSSSEDEDEEEEEEGGDDDRGEDEGD